jgi:radical SAM protein with 4Fe4S-binding SPASM domain
VDYSALYRAIVAAYSAVPKRLLRGYALPPLQIFIELTRRCNLRCAMCQNLLYMEQMSVDEEKAEELTLDDWKRVIGEMPRLALITFTGGEPLFRADFAEILKYTCARRRCHVITNGALLDAEVAELMVASAARNVLLRGLVFVGISIHGPAEIHAAITQVPGSFAKAAEGAGNLAEMKAKARSKLPLVYLCTVLTKETVETLPEMATIAKECSADILNIPLCSTSLDLSIEAGATMETMLKYPRPPDPIEEDLLRDRLSETQQRCSELGIQLRLPRMPISEIVNHYAGKWHPSHYTCNFPWSKTVISPYGNVYTCHHYEVGSLKETPLRKIWNSAEYRRFRQAAKQHGAFPICAGCCEIGYSPSKARRDH